MAVSNPYIAREGWAYIGLIGAGAYAARYFYGDLAALPLYLLLILLIFVFRDPEREIPSSPLAIVSPVDGRVEKVMACHDPYLDRDAVLIRIRMFIHGVYSTRSPVEGKALSPPQHPAGPAGEPLPHGVWLQTDEQDAVVLVMYRGPLGNPPRCYVRLGERVGQGQRCGFIYLGSRIDVYVPANSRINVAAGDRVRAGADSIAALIHA